jgi:hypothetical protein
METEVIFSGAQSHRILIKILIKSNWRGLHGARARLSVFGGDAF